MQINEGVWLVLEREVDDFMRKVPSCFIYLTEVPGGVIRSSVTPHGPSVIKGELDEHLPISNPSSALHCLYQPQKKPEIITILVQTPLRGSKPL